MDRQGESLCLGANEEEASGNPSGLAATILRAAFRSRIYVSNRETYPALTKALQKGGVHIRPHMTAPNLLLNLLKRFELLENSVRIFIRSSSLILIKWIRINNSLRQGKLLETI